MIAMLYGTVSGVNWSLERTDWEVVDEVDEFHAAEAIRSFEDESAARGLTHALLRSRTGAPAFTIASLWSNHTRRLCLSIRAPSYHSPLYSHQVKMQATRILRMQPTRFMRMQPSAIRMRPVPVRYRPHLGLGIYLLIHE